MDAQTRRQVEVAMPSAPSAEPRRPQRRWTSWLPIALVLAAGAYFLPPLLQPAPLEVRLATVVLREVGLPPVVPRPSVPRSALRRRGGRSYVLLVENGLVQEVPVVIAGRRSPAPSTKGAAFSATADAVKDFVALLDGPREGASVVDSPPAALASGTAVRAAQ